MRIQETKKKQGKASFKNVQSSIGQFIRDQKQGQSFLEQDSGMPIDGPDGITFQ